MRVSSFDYVQSLNDQWVPPLPPDPHNDWTNPTGVYANPDPLVAEQIMGHIQGLTADQLQAIVQALPPDCMPPLEGIALATGLHERAKRLAEVLGPGLQNAKSRT